MEAPQFTLRFHLPDGTHRNASLYMDIKVQDALILLCQQAKQDHQKFCLFFQQNDSSAMQGHRLVREYYPQAQPGTTVDVFVALTGPKVRFQDPPVAQAGRGAANKDLASVAAKNVKLLGQMAEDALATLLTTCSESTLREIAALRVQKEKRKAGGDGAKKDEALFEFMTFYAKIKENMLVAWDNHDSDGRLALSVYVPKELTFEEYCSSFPQADPVEAMCHFVRNAEDAVRGVSRLSIINSITQGVRLIAARSLFDRLKAANQLQVRGIATWSQFLRRIGENYTTDYVRKLRKLAMMCTEYPNICLVSCCGVGEIVNHAPRLLQYFMKDQDEALLWRRDKKDNMEWSRANEVFLGEPGLAHDPNRNKRVCWTFGENGAAELPETWNERRVAATKKLLEEEANEEASAKADKGAEVEKAAAVLGKMNMVDREKDD